MSSSSSTLLTCCPPSLMSEFRPISNSYEACVRSSSLNMVIEDISWNMLDNLFTLRSFPAPSEPFYCPAGNIDNIWVTLSLAGIKWCDEPDGYFFSLSLFIRRWIPSFGSASLQLRWVERSSESAVKTVAHFNNLKWSSSNMPRPHALFNSTKTELDTLGSGYMVHGRTS